MSVKVIVCYREENQESRAKNQDARLQISNY